MLVGEGLNYSGLDNDYFGFNGQKKDKKAEKKAAKAEKKAAKVAKKNPVAEVEKKKQQAEKTKQVLNNLDTGITKVGQKAEELAKTFGNVKRYLKDESPTTPDFDVNMGQGQVEEEKKKGVPTMAWVIGGVALLLTGTLAFFHFRGGAVPPPGVKI